MLRGDKPTYTAYTPPGKAFPASARRFEEGRIGWVLLWLLGIPVPILLGLYLLRGCT